MINAGKFPPPEKASRAGTRPAPFILRINIMQGKLLVRAPTLDVWGL